MATLITSWHIRMVSRLPHCCNDSQVILNKFAGILWYAAAAGIGQGPLADTAGLDQGATGATAGLGRASQQPPQG